MRLAILLLAAGLSRRFGAANKLLTLYQDRPLIDHSADLARSIPAEARFAAVSDASVSDRLAGFDCVTVPDPELGMGASMAAASTVALQTGCDRFLVLLADMPNVTAEHTNALLALSADYPLVASASEDGVRMPPACFDRQTLEAVGAGAGDAGARTLIKALPESALVSATNALLHDIDTVDDLQASPAR
ncbi:MAG: NTP transferase domain-containing protein [Devosiaceae bacterium]|nr:NTP transferase domain-containing protein [Devosiaceae bacterium MH13]